MTSSLAVFEAAIRGTYRPRHIR